MLILSVLLAALYLGAASIRLRTLPESVSALVYLLPHGGWQWLWTLWLWAVTFLLTPALIEAMPDAWRFFALLCVACLLFVGAVPLFDTDHHRLHNALGIASGILSQACVWFVSPWWLLLWLLMAAVGVDAWFVHPRLPRWYDHKGVLIAELICAATVYGSLLI